MRCRWLFTVRTESDKRSAILALQPLGREDRDLLFPCRERFRSRHVEETRRPGTFAVSREPRSLFAAIAVAVRPSPRCR